MPNALLFGVSYDLFWHLNPQKLKPFKMAYQKKIEQDNYHSWLQGIYMKAAVSCALFGKKAKYPDRPFKSSDEADESKKESADVASKKFDAWSKIFNEKFEKNES